MNAVIERIAVQHVFPMFAVPDFDEGGRADADEVPIDAVVFDDLVMDELFGRSAEKIGENIVAQVTTRVAVGA